MSRHRSRTAFTLVELLVVMSIIAVLVGMLVPAVSRAIISVRIVHTRDILKRIDAGLAAFRNDFGAYPPSFETPPSGDPLRGQSRKHIVGAATDSKWYGNENLCFYLAGPTLNGWGSQSLGRRPFGGTAERDYGPYFKGDDIAFGYNPNTHKRETILDGFPKDLRPIFYFRAAADGNFIFADCPVYDQNVVDSYGYGDANQFNKITAHGQVTHKPYLLISPGEDRWYGEIVQDPVTKKLRPWKQNDTAKAEYDDITNFE